MNKRRELSKRGTVFLELNYFLHPVYLLFIILFVNCMNFNKLI